MPDLRWGLLVVWCWCVIGTCAGEGEALPCCPEGDEISKVTRSCNGTNGRVVVALSCPPTYKRILVRDIILQGTGLSSSDMPDVNITDDASMYCVGRMSGVEGRVAVVCHKMMYSGDAEETDDVETMGVLSLVSSVFLFATFCVYAYFPQLRDLQGMCYLCLCVSMALGYLWLGILQLSPGFERLVCTVTGFLVYFFMMATFFWMNVISINVYRTTTLKAKGSRDAGGKGGDAEARSTFWTYSAYAWGGSALLLIVALATDLAQGTHYRPGIGTNSCWFAGRTETWIFFYGPIAALVASNVALFLCASWRLWRAHEHALAHVNLARYGTGAIEVLKYKFLLSLKLFLVMGVSWVFEIASYAHGESHVIWKITDTINCLQGVIIFVLLVLLRRRALCALTATRACCCPRVGARCAAALSRHDVDIDETAALHDADADAETDADAGDTWTY